VTNSAKIYHYDDYDTVVTALLPSHESVALGLAEDFSFTELFHYDFLCPAVLDAAVDQLILEFARKGYDDLQLLQCLEWDRPSGLGVIDVETENVESPDLVAARIRRAVDVIGLDRLIVNPDCWLRHLSADVARTKLRTWSKARRLSRDELPSKQETGANGATPRGTHEGRTDEAVG